MYFYLHIDSSKMILFKQLFTNIIKSNLHFYKTLISFMAIGNITCVKVQ